MASLLVIGSFLCQPLDLVGTNTPTHTSTFIDNAAVQHQRTVVLILSSFLLLVLIGYRYINLKNELNQPLLLPSLLVHIDAHDYIPNEHQGTNNVSSAPCTSAFSFSHIIIVNFRDIEVFP